ncbi:unnamed protein product [Caenorhabditis auriculariae]|uniref:Clathrin light chain n=1 Tax=Caenorhabditis auriculariae TaxID=2777116 RepID=A0A8S1HS59_9PELO|nr:unnamed protein product [Caenorhabditis auriculariae]
MTSWMPTSFLLLLVVIFALLPAANKDVPRRVNFFSGITMADPVAEFLAREQNIFAEFDGAPPAEAPPVAVPADDEQDDFWRSSGRSTCHNLPAEVSAPAPAPLVNGNGHLSSASSKGPTPVPYTVPRIEAEKIRLWKEQQRELLEKKDEAEEKRKVELRANAKKELEEWNRQREKTLALAHEENKKNEKANLEAFAKQQDGEAQWAQVSSMIEQSKSKSSKDLSRLKSLLSGLKDVKISDK